MGAYVLYNQPKATRLAGGYVPFTDRVKHTFCEIDPKGLDLQFAINPGQYLLAVIIIE